MGYILKLLILVKGINYLFLHYFSIVGEGARVGVVLIIFFLPTGEKMMMSEEKKMTIKESGKRKILFIAFLSIFFY